MGAPYRAVKRATDIAVSAVALAALSPVIAVTALAVAIRLGRPVIFSQPRPGLHGRVFMLRKFRTMLPVDESRGQITDADRMTPFGRALRSTSLDELPTLWNVLRGDMSLVGPRPLLVEYLPLYNERQARRHEVRPGVTGLAQVSGRNLLDWPTKLELDVQYVESQSWTLDLRIVGRTFRSVLKREGISANGVATMSPFSGNTPSSAGNDD